MTLNTQSSTPDTADSPISIEFELPFTIAPTAQTHFVGDEVDGMFHLPKYGSVTFAEELAIIRILKEANISTAEGRLNSQAGLAAIALSRLGKPILVEALHPLSRDLIEALSDFILSERNRWKPIGEVMGEEVGKEKLNPGMSTNDRSSEPIEISITDFSTDSPEMPDSEPIALPDVPST